MKKTIEDLESVESKNEELKENINEANECIKKPRGQIWKFKKRQWEVNKEFKQVNETAMILKLQIEERKKVEEFGFPKILRGGAESVSNW